MKARGQLSVSSITRTDCSLASFTIWRRLNIKNISTIILGARAERTPTSRWRSAIEISIARRVPARISKKCSTTTAIANLPDPRRTLSRRWRSLRRIMPQLFRRSAGKSREPAVALSAHYFEARCLEALGRKEEAANIYVEVAEAGNPNPYREDARVTAASIFAGRGRKIDALKQYEALANEAQKPALKAESAVRGGVIALELIQPEKGKIDKAMADRATALLQKGRTLPEAGKFRAIAQVGLRRLQYQTGQYAQLVADYKKDLEKLPEAAQAEVLLLAANSERQLANSKEAEALYRQIIAKFPDREEAKDAAYERLINVYNSDPSAISGAVDEFLATNPTNERADQAKLLKAEALYKQQNYNDAALIYGELRWSQLSARLRAEAAYKLGLCHVQTKNVPSVIEAFTYYVQTFPDN